MSGGLQPLAQHTNDQPEGATSPFSQCPPPHPQLCPAPPLQPHSCLLPFLASLQGPHSDLAHTAFHALAPGPELLPVCVSLEDAGCPLPAPWSPCSPLPCQRPAGRGTARSPGGLAARHRGVFCMNCFYRVCLDQQSKRNSTSSDRTRLR